MMIAPEATYANRESGEFKTLQDADDIISAVGLPLPRFLPRRYKARNVDSWSGHLAFASDLIIATQPELIVELGTHWGEAYFSFCQTVQENGLGSLCYAVDHWRGDKHAGHYGEEVFEEVRKYNDRFYRQFSYLLRSNFDDAVSQFGDASIGLLHIDGLHTYEAVSHDFQTWWPKVKQGGVVLLHDICPKHEEFGVWRLWDEIKAEFPNTFEFHHSWGLGVLRKDANARNSTLAESLFRSSPSVQEEIRRRYVIYASHLENVLSQTPDATPQQAGLQNSGEIRVQVFPFGTTGYSEETSFLQELEPETWNTLVFELPEGIGNGPLRIDPAHEPSIVEIGEILIHSHSSEELLWSGSPSSDPSTLLAAGTATVLPTNSGSLLLSSGDDPQFMLSVPPNIEGAVKMTISLRVSRMHPLVLENLNALIAEAYKGAERQVAVVQRSAEEQITAAQRSAEEQITAAQRSAEEQVAAAHRSATERVTAAQREASEQVAAAKTIASEQLAATQLERDNMADQVTRAIAQNQTMQQTLHMTEARLREEENTNLALQQSLSWRITEPVRRLMSILRSGPRITR